MLSMMVAQQAACDTAPVPTASAEDMATVAALRGGDETAFMALVETYQPSMIRLAMHYVAGRAVAEEVVQDTWVAVLQGLERFAGRSSLKTWIFRILINIAMTRGKHESRSIPFSLALRADDGSDQLAVDPDRFGPDGHWIAFPPSWDGLPEESFLADEMLGHIRGAIAKLPTQQRQVMTLRDIEGWDAAEVCSVLGISDANQRVLLHRARSRVRQAIEAYMLVTA